MQKESESIMAININKKEKDEKKFELAGEALNEHELLDKEKTKNVIQKLAGVTGEMKMIQDKNGRVRRVRVKEPRKAFQVYLPISVYEQLDDILKKNGKSRNSVIEELIREYVNN